MPVESGVHPQTLACGRSLETLESPPPALELSEEGAPGVGSSVSMTLLIGAPCKPGQEGEPHTLVLVPQGARKSEGHSGRVRPLGPSEQNARPPRRGVSVVLERPPAVLVSGWLVPGAVAQEEGD